MVAGLRFPIHSRKPRSIRGLPPPGGLRCRLRSRDLTNTFSGRRARYAPDRSSCESLGSSSAALSSNATMGSGLGFAPSHGWT